MPRARPLLVLVLLCPAVGTGAWAQSTPLPAGAARFAMVAKVAPPGGRFTLDDAEVTARKTAAAPRFALATATSKGLAACAIDDALFADGFED